MKFLRHLAAVVLVVAVIVGLGVLWAHASGGGAGIGSGFKQVPSHQALLRIRQIKAGVIRLQPDDGIHLADTGNLIRTCEIEAVLATAVIAISVVRRWHRRMRRNAAAGA